MDGGDKHRTTKDWKSEMIILERRDGQQQEQLKGALNLNLLLSKQEKKV
jgi:hypothetical protein